MDMRIVNPAIAASLAALLAAIGVEVREPPWSDIIEYVSMALAVIGILMGVFNSFFRPTVTATIDPKPRGGKN